MTSPIPPACQLCRGACCESIVLNMPVRDAPAEAVWLGLHGTVLPDGRLELRTPCSRLDGCGRCTIHDIRPSLCRNFEVGGADCRATIARRRPERALQIHAALPAA